MSTIKIVAKRVFPEDKAEEALRIYEELKVETRKEDGCITYELFQDVRQKGTLVMIEEWRDMAAFKAHTVAKHVQQLGPKLAELGNQPLDLSVLTKVF